MPKDPIILLSYINTKLRNSRDDDFSEICRGEGADPEKVRKTLESAGFVYDRATNQFR